MRSIYFHEDDYLQLELLPLAAKSFCLEEMDDIESFAGEHWTGGGYSDAFQRTEATCATKDLGLHREQLDAALDFLPAFDHVETGYGACRVECRTTYARGLGSDLAIFWEQDEDGHVENIWLELCIDSGQTELTCRVLTALGTVAPLVLADWNRCVCVNLASVREIERYIEVKA
ncbi:MAG: hypothetical protein K2O34_01795 [Acetatifactor sp.]|nr:hypothetical protein [Acetatifactor sp.]